jgi:hypothetical protein
MIVDYETLLKELGESEVANISADFWLSHRNPPKFRDVDPHHPVWDELRAFQLGWARCRKFYNIKD